MTRLAPISALCLNAGTPSEAARAPTSSVTFDLMLPSDRMAPPSRVGPAHDVGSGSGFRWHRIRENRVQGQVFQALLDLDLVDAHGLAAVSEKDLLDLLLALGRARADPEDETAGG